jgi:hypothetical protein
MFRISARSLSVLVTALIVSTAAQGALPKSATPKEVARPPAEAELTGIWKQVAVTPVSPNVDLSDDWYSATQYYHFLGEGKLKTLIVEGGDVDLPRRYLGVWKKSPALWSFDLQGNGMTVLSHKDRGPMYLIKLEAVVRDVDTAQITPDVFGKDADSLPRKGDVTMTYMGKDLQPVFYRVLRRYTPAE